MRVTILLPPILRPWKAHWAAIELRKQRAKLATSSRPLAELWFGADAPAGRASSTWSRSRLHRTSNDFAASQELCVGRRLLSAAFEVELFQVTPSLGRAWLGLEQVNQESRAADKSVRPAQ